MFTLICSLVANLAVTKWCKKAEKFLKSWHIGTHLRVLCDSYPINTNIWQGFDDFQKSVRPHTLDESSLSIGRVNRPRPAAYLDRPCLWFSQEVFVWKVIHITPRKCTWGFLEIPGIFLPLCWKSLHYFQLHLVRVLRCDHPLYRQTCLWHCSHAAPFT